MAKKRVTKRVTDKAVERRAIDQAKAQAEFEAKSSAPKPVAKPKGPTAKNPSGTRATRVKATKVEALRDQGLDVPAGKTAGFTLTPKPVKPNKNAPKHRARTQANIDADVQRIKDARETRRAKGLAATGQTNADAQAKSDVSALNVAAIRVQRRQAIVLARLRRLAPNNPLVTGQAPEDLSIIKQRLAKMPKSKVVAPKTPKVKDGITKKQAILKATFEERLKAAGKLPATEEGNTNG